MQRISIGSYNFHSCVGLDFRHSPSRIAAVLREMACDIYALQEVDNERGDDEDSMQLEFLSRELHMAAIPGLRIVRHSGQYGNALLTRLPIVSVHRHDLSYSWFEPRGALDVQLDLGDHKLRVIAAVVIGGTSLSGGRGSVVGALVGALLMTTITSGCTQLGLPNPIQDVIVGLIIIAAVTLDQFRQRRLPA